MNLDDEKLLLSEVKSGLHREKYLVYARKSTDDTENQKNSIKYQKAEALREAARAHLPVAALTLSGFCTDGMVSERHSAFKESVHVDFGDDGAVQYRVERPKFHRLMEFLSKRYFKGVIVLCWDRFSRNKADEVIIRKLMKAGIDIRFVRTQYDRGSAGELHMDIDGMFSEHHSRVTREKVTDTMRAKRAEGVCTHRANVGYLNQGRMEWKPLDPERAPVVRRLFELAATTDWSLADLARWAIGQGFTMPPTRRKRTDAERLADDELDEQIDREKICRPPTANNIHYILTSPFYTGKVRGNDGTWVRSTSHDALIGEELFGRVQARLTQRRTSLRYPKMLDHPFRGLARCRCGRVYTPYEQKGAVYYGSRCARDCINPRKSINFGMIDGWFASFVQNLWLTDAQIAEFEASAETEIARDTARRATHVDDAERRKKTLREDLGYLADNKVTLLRTGAYTAEALAAEEARLVHALSIAEVGPEESAGELRQVVARGLTLSELVKSVANVYEFSKPVVKDLLVRPIISELTVFDTTAKIQCKNAFGWLQAYSSQPSGLYWSPSELLAHQGDLEVAVLALTEALGAHVP